MTVGLCVVGGVLWITHRVLSPQRNLNVIGKNAGGVWVMGFTGIPEGIELGDRWVCAVENGKSDGQESPMLGVCPGWVVEHFAIKFVALKWFWNEYWAEGLSYFIGSWNLNLTARAMHENFGLMCWLDSLLAWGCCFRRYTCLRPYLLSTVCSVKKAGVWRGLCYFVLSCLALLSLFCWLSLIRRAFVSSVLTRFGIPFLGFCLSWLGKLSFISMAWVPPGCAGVFVLLGRVGFELT